MNIPEAIKNEATRVVANLLPQKSSAKYEREYLEFKKWQKRNEVIGVTEDVLLAYLNQLSVRFSPNSLWSKWSMLKSCLEMKENFHANRCRNILSFLKRKSERYNPKKAKVLTKEEVERFLLEAPDDEWLLAKIITIFGIFGCYRCDELLSLKTNDVEDTGKYIVVKLRETKNLTTRSFVISDDGCSFQPCALYRKYVSLRPPAADSLRFFLTYRNGKCVSLNAGQYTIGGIPNKIAKYLGLKDPELYTGHSFRRTGATMVVDAGGDILALKRAGGWKSTAVATSYVDDSINNKVSMSKKMFAVDSTSISKCPNTTPLASITDSSACAKLLPHEELEKFRICGNHNCTMNFNIYYDGNHKTAFSNVNNNK